MRPPDKTTIKPIGTIGSRQLSYPMNPLPIPFLAGEHLAKIILPSLGEKAAANSTSKGFLFQKVLQAFAAARVTKLTQRFCFNLADALSGDIKLLAYLLQGAAPAILQAKAKL